MQLQRHLGIGSYKTAWFMAHRIRHTLKDPIFTKKLAGTFAYLYEPLKIYDFAFDPSVVNGIVQPSSLVMGYVYRPYTANSFTFGLRYLW